MAGSAWTNQVQNQVIIAGSNGQLLVYSGSPAAGNLIGSISSAGGTDLYGNVYLGGIVSYVHGAFYTAIQMFQGNLQFYTAGTEAGPWTRTGEVAVNQSGIMTITATTITALVEADGNVYNVARLTVPMTPTGQTINSTSAATVNNLSANLAAVAYQVRGVVQFTANASAGAPSFQLSSSATTSGQWGNAILWQASGAGAGANAFRVNESAMLFQGPTMVSGATYLVQIDAFLTCTGTGTLALQAFTSNASDTFTINNAFLEVNPLA